MANIYTRNPIYIDTAFQSYKAQVAATLGALFTLRVSKVVWVAPVSVGDQIEFVDPQGGDQQLLIRNTVANGPDIERNFIPAIMWADFGVPVMPVGSKLLIYTI